MTQNKTNNGWTIEEVKASLGTYTKAQLDEHLGKYIKAYLKAEASWLVKQEPRVAYATDIALTFIKNKNLIKEPCSQFVLFLFSLPIA